MWTGLASFLRNFIFLWNWHIPSIILFYLQFGLFCLHSPLNGLLIYQRNDEDWSPFFHSLPYWHVLFSASVHDTILSQQILTSLYLRGQRQLGFLHSDRLYLETTACMHIHDARNSSLSPLIVGVTRLHALPLLFTSCIISLCSLYFY